MSVKRKILVWSLVALATLLLLISSLTVWTKRQVLNTDNWTDLSGQLLASDTIRSAVSAKMVNALFQRVDVAGELRQQLPDQLQAAAPVLAGALENVAPRAANAVLGTNAAQALWKEANRRMHTQLIAVLKGEKVRNVSSEGGDVTLDLRPLIHRLAGRLHISDALKANADPNTGLILILRSNQLEAVQKAVRVIKVVSIFVVIAVLLLFGLALLLARPSRRKVLGGIGGCIFGVGLLLLVLQRLLGTTIIDSVVKVEQNKRRATRSGNSRPACSGNRHRAHRLRPGRDRGQRARRAESRRRDRASLARARFPPVRGHRLRRRDRDLPDPARLVSLGSDRGVIGTIVLAALVLWGIELLRRQTLREFPAEAPVEVPPGGPPPRALRRPDPCSSSLPSFCCSSSTDPGTGSPSSS